MKTFSEILGLDVPVTQKLAETAVPAGKQLAQRVTPTLERISPYDLEAMYIHNPVIFNGINKIVEVIMSGHYSLSGTDKNVDVIQSFLSSIGDRGGSTDWQSLLYSVFQHQCIFGMSYNEIVYSRGKKEIRDLDFIDPKTMEYAQTTDSQILLDNYGNPLGFVQTLPITGRYSNLPTDPAPKDCSLKSNQIFLKSERILQYKLFTVGDMFQGIGLVEPIYRVALYKTRLTEAQSNLYLQLGPRQVVYIGDEQHEFTNELAQRTAEQVAQAQYNSIFVLPNYSKYAIEEPKHPEKLQEELRYLVEQETTVLGPQAFITGSGQTTNRATLNRQEAIFKLALKDIIRRTTSIIEKGLFKKIIQLNGLEEGGVPNIIWGKIDLEELDSQATRLTKYADSMLIKPDKKLERFIRKSEGLP